MRTTDRARFEALYLEHYGAVLRYALRRVGPSVAEEIAAETFAVAWRRLEQVPASKPLPWLLTSARNTIANRARGEQREASKTDAHRRVTPMATTRDLGEALAARDAIGRAFAALSETDREALRLSAWEGLTLEDAAKVAGITRLAFAMRLSRARRRLTASLTEPDPLPHSNNRLEHIT